MAEVSFYFGGDELYRLKDIPGIWHEVCLRPVSFRKIVGFHQDAEEHWVADLDCGHSQHVRHDPPWQVRPWVLSTEGRAKLVGTALSCRKCTEDGERAD